MITLQKSKIDWKSFNHLSNEVQATPSVKEVTQHGYRPEIQSWIPQAAASV